MNQQEKQALHARCRKHRKQNAKRIRGQMLSNGYTLTDLAENQGVSVQAISNVLNGRKHTPNILDAMLAAGANAIDLADPRQEVSNAK